MKTLSSELSELAHLLASGPRVYADANVPAGLVGFMRSRLHWDVLFVVEHEEMRRLSDAEHYQMAQQLSRTLVTLDRDYLDDGRFPPERTSGVVVVSAADERGMARILSRLDRSLFRPGANAGGGCAGDATPPPLPLAGRKLLVHPDWAEQP